MKLDEYIDDFIRKEKREQVNPFLATRVLTKLSEAEKQEPAQGKYYVLKTLALAVSFALIVMLGIGFGNIGRQAENYAFININDSQIENLSLYIADNYE